MNKGTRMEPNILSSCAIKVNITHRVKCIDQGECWKINIHCVKKPFSSLNCGFIDATIQLFMSKFDLWLTWSRSNLTKDQVS